MANGIDKLTEIYKTIVTALDEAKVPEALREEAFGRGFDYVTGTAPAPAPPPPSGGGGSSQGDAGKVDVSGALEKITTKLNIDAADARRVSKLIKMVHTS